MDPQLTGFPDLLSTFEQQDEFLFSSTFQRSQELDSPEDRDADPVFKFLNEILLEENIDEKPSMSHDPVALEAAEKYFYEALDQNPPSTYGSHISHNNTESLKSMHDISSGPLQLTVDPGRSKSSFAIPSPEPSFRSSFQTTSSESSIFSLNGYRSSTDIQVDSMLSSSKLGNIFSDTEAILQFKKGMEEVSQFLPATNQLVIDLDNYLLPPKTDEMPNDTFIKVENTSMDSSFNKSLRRMNHQHPDPDNNEFEEERSSKQSAVYVEEELSEMFDNVLLCDPIECRMNILPPSEVGNDQPHNAPKGAGLQALPETVGNKKRRPKKQQQEGTTSEAVDLGTLLIGCAQSIAADDRKSAYEQLRVIWKHCSLNGDANQRLAYILANGLEARLAGTGTQLYASRPPKRITAYEKLKAYQVYMSACPFKKIALAVGNKMIYMVSLEAKALHIIDFGIEYGFQWPVLIQHLSIRPGGPPKLRITGIDLPQSGFRPAELIEDTGRRLAKYCERFGVPFEYNAIANRNWETMKVEDLKLVRGEMVAVNCSYRLKCLLDESVLVDSPRDAVLNLIRKLNPSIFVHSVSNGSYSSPFFVARFRETLFHYSSFFDFFDSTLPRDDQQRFLFEQEFFGREALNVIACEGTERIVRPETYKQWQVRTVRAGFKPLVLDPDIMLRMGKKIKAGYHEDFMLGKDGNWMLQGWKGRILYACSFWEPL
ncbi:unnamed protein product [Cuscuta europaea]|uniref:Scarecrow-like protein 14 n=1 Tax=Cuscuta europaea TaxID=41803 RepID=A0A9P0YS30_CUSEU|nr:unnamed protein product [Cuscuta europaea]